MNELGVWIRSHLLGIPFGDQGLALSRETFLKVGGFEVGRDCGEDHYFIWKARQSRVRVRSVGASIRTSARKYKRLGWRETTKKHIAITFQQAFPEWLKLQRIRFRRIWGKITHFFGVRSTVE